MGDAIMTLNLAKWQESSYLQSKSSKLFVSICKVTAIVLIITVMSSYYEV